jgi:hypothetical protein
LGHFSRLSTKRMRSTLFRHHDKSKTKADHPVPSSPVQFFALIQQCTQAYK